MEILIVTATTLIRYARPLALVPLVAALAACSVLDLVAPADEGLTVDLVVEPARHGEWLETTEVAARGGDGAIVVETRMSTPDPCRNLHASVYQQDGEIVLAVRVRSEGDPCVGIVGRFDYVATVSGVEPGPRAVRVTHLIEGTGNPGPHTVHLDEVLVR